MVKKWWNGGTVSVRNDANKPRNTRRYEASPPL
jgi:hypothetical protein